MSGYNYGPPPPPPPAAQASHPGYSHHSGPYQHHSRGNGAPAARGGRAGYSSNGRPEYPPAPQPQYEYSRQQPYPQPSPGYPAQPTSGSYPPQQQWHQEHAHSTPQHGAHAPTPLSSSNYHPNYAPQVYSHPQHAQPPPHQPGYGPPQQQQYGQPYHNPTPYSAPQQWAGHDQHAQNQYGAGRGRGGYGNDRGGARAPSMSAPAPVAYGNEGIQHQVGGGYSQPYGDPRAQQVPYAAPPQYPYHAPPPPAPHASGPSHEPYYKQDGQSGRGRGGFRGNNMRGRGFHHGNDRARHRSQGNHNHNHRQDGGFHKHDNSASGKKKKRKTNTLGLTPGQDSDSEDDEMEEETLRKLIGSDALQVTDVAAYIAERKKRFPTAARVKAKKSAEVANGSSDKFAAALEKEENLASKLRKQLEKVESSIKRKREQQDEGDEMRDSSPIDLKSEDDEPEVVSSRVQQAPPPPPPAKKADVTKHCKYYSTGGTCGKKGKCRFVHDPAVREAAIKEREANNGQLTIQQRLILNDKDQEDLTVLQSIQYLREKGLMKDEENNTPKGPNGHHTSGNSTQTRQQSSLPAAHSSLPPPPMKHHNGLPPHNPPPSSLSTGNSGSTVRYKGWNLSGYGNSGLKSEDLP
ncbi:nuclear fragile x mental retardation-interacting protein 1 [Colletotrichum truncatum]|uniref:Nuclear fragile x mental retardation-interacting protein 1 n=1 Tax=Colletotrichum truncatum TaxID=5467 RepID=A0ACC3YWZ3_COLTU|nr:nuclear fragile x mental retardation-interacting protein 1 [Colletotrichum truncatum]KAF6792575.1 nuclear fragile x mental retardation-interacting protein 1 [Colletotrichum truncatum]